MENSEKRFRAPNYSKVEGLHLCSIIEKYKRSIENKATDGDSLKQKQKAWGCVGKEYNETTPSYSRTVESLQNCYKKLKQKAKKSNSDAKMQIQVNKKELKKEMQVHGASNGDAVVTELKRPETKCETATVTEDAEMEDSVIKKRVTGTVGGTLPYHGDSNILFNKVISLVRNFIEEMNCAFNDNAEIMRECSTSQDSLKLIPSAAAIELINNSHGNTNEFTAEDLNKNMDLPTANHTTFTNNRENIKRIKDIALALTHNCADTPNKKIKRETILETVSQSVNENAELILMHKEVLSMQLKEEKYKMEHSKLLRELELEAIKKKYDQEEQMRQEQLKLIKFDVLLKEKQLNISST